MLVDEVDGAIFESNPILWRSASKTGQFQDEGRWSMRVMQCLFVQSAKVAHPPRNHVPLRHRAANPPVTDWRTTERVLVALETSLTGGHFAGSYSVPDVAFVPPFRREFGEAEYGGCFRRRGPGSGGVWRVRRLRRG